MKKKTMFFVIVCALVTAVAAFAAACGGEKATLATFDVPESMTVEHMTMCKLPVVAAVDSAGREYVADVSVSDADGMTVSVLNYSFFVEKESPYMAEYSVTVEGERTARTMRIDVTPSQAAFIRLTGKLQYWLEPGAFDVAALDYTVIDADGAEVTGAVIEYAVTDAAGQTVDLSDGKATLAEGTYEVRVTADGEAAVNSIALFVTEKKTDADGRYVYADFADEIVRNLFSTDYTPIYGSVGNGIAWTGMMRSWSETAPSWRIVFLSDGFADFTHGGRVQFDSVMMLDNTGYQVYYYPADGSERQLIGDFPNLGWYQNNTLSFDIAAGGSLEGAYLEFVKTEEGAVWGHAVGNFLISTGYQAEGELQAAVTDGSTVDLDELAVTISDFTGNPADGTRTYAVVRADGSPVTPDSANAFLAEAGNVYTVTVSVGGVAAIPSIQIGCTEERYDEAGRLVYADFGDTADGVPDELDAYQILPDYSNSVMYYELGWEGAKYGLTKYYTAGLSTWSYTFLSDGYADFTNGGVVSFDAVIAAATGAYTAYYYPADGGERITVASFEELGDQEVKNLSFTIPAGGTLVGGRLEFVSEKSDETFVFGNITIDTRLKLAADTQFVGPGDSVDLDTIDIAITNASGEPVTGTKQYTVQTFGGTDVTLGGSTFTPENDTGYTVTVSVNGIETAEPVVVICRDKRTDGEGRIVYADFGNTADGNPDMLDSYLFAASYDNPGYLAIGWQGAKYGMSKAWTLGLTTWSYTFLSDGYADFANGGTVSLTR